MLNSPATLAARQLVEVLDEAPVGSVVLDRPLALVEAVDLWPSGTVLTSTTPVDQVEAILAEAQTRAVDGLDQLAAGYPGQSGSDRPEMLLRHLFGGESFVGNQSDYYHPSNSRITEVLGRRAGLPLTLAAIAVEVGRRHGLPLRAVGMPGHVLLCDTRYPEQWWDPFAGGAALDLSGCANLYRRLGTPAPFQRAMLNPMSAAEVVTRTINNLYIAHVKRGMPSASIGVLTLRSEMGHANRADWQRLIKTLIDGGHFEEAAQTLERLATREHSRADEFLASARRLRSRWN